MLLKRTSVAALCLALLLVAVVRAEASSAGVGASSFDGAARSEAARGVSREGRRRRRRARKVSKRTTDGNVAEGVWGGAHVRLNVTASGGQIEFDCAHGEINEAFKTDSDGRFDVAGTLTREGGPIRLDHPRPSRAARYVGRVEGATMTLNVKFTGTEETTESYTLMRGSGGRLWKCR